MLKATPPYLSITAAQANAARASSMQSRTSSRPSVAGVRGVAPVRIQCAKCCSSRRNDSS